MLRHKECRVACFDRGQPPLRAQYTLEQGRTTDVLVLRLETPGSMAPPRRSTDLRAQILPGKDDLSAVCIKRLPVASPSQGLSQFLRRANPTIPNLQLSHHVLKL